ncbi:MAG: cysteine hydrolase [Solobacterium sp.]|nr:cysteine hydrolase [Solobacterium sp.]
MNVLIVVDMQNDFIDGALGTAEAVKIVDRVTEEIGKDCYDQVIATLDTHEENYMQTLEGKYLPVPHCIDGTEGWKIRKEIMDALEKRNALLIKKPTFGSEVLVEKIKELQPDTITLVGLCTDICVISNALLLRAACRNTEMGVVQDCCAGVTPEKHEAALKVMESCQIQVK